MKKSKKIAICIPTYNRSIELKKIVSFLVSEFDSLDDEKSDLIDLYIRDNASIEALSQENKKNIKEFNRNFLIYNTNEKNIGLIGNLKKMFSFSCEKEYEYIWFVGDDDEFYPGILKKVLNMLDKGFDYIFINHKTTFNGVDRMHSALPNNIQEIRNSMDIYIFSRTTIMFISANIYKMELLKKCMSKIKEDDCRLSLPLWLSLYCGKQNIGIIQDVCINNICDTTSWSENQNVVFDYLVPKEIIRSVFIGYNPLRFMRVYILNLFKLTRFNIKKYVFR